MAGRLTLSLLLTRSPAAESGKSAGELGKQERRRVRIWKPRRHEVIRRLIRSPRALTQPFGLPVDVTRLPPAPFPPPDFRRLILLWRRSATALKSVKVRVNLWLLSFPEFLLS